MKISSLKNFKLFVYCIILTFQISLQDITEHENWALLNGAECGESMMYRIINGEESIAGQFPWMTRLGYISKTLLITKPIFACGGALINENYVITAAHCIFPLKKLLTLVVVRLGEYDLTIDNQLLHGERVQEIPIQHIIRHEYFDTPHYKHDIALLRLVTPAILNTYVKPICLSPQRIISPDDVGERLQVIGWGVTDLNNTVTSKLLYVFIPVAHLEECIEGYKHTTQVGEGQLCVGGELGYDSCKGDSGGPLIKASTLYEMGTPKYYLIGLVSFGAKSCGSPKPAVYTDVYYYLEWILDHIQP